MAEIAGWTSVVLGQIVAWPQLLKLRCDRGDGISLVSYGVLLVSMGLYFVHALGIADPVTIVAVPLSLIPNAVIAVVLVRRRTSEVELRAVARGACPRAS